jgi:Domain of unknown function (DUF305)
LLDYRFRDHSRDSVLGRERLCHEKNDGGHGINATGDVDADFVAMMVPHHQGAIDMAVAALRYGRNAQIRRLAQEIIVTQLQEIAALRLAVDQPLPPSVPAPTQVPTAGQLDSKSSHPANPIMEP